ncbi:MAG: nucleotide pyrophosphohydrolase [Planctomycetia bacterium]
MGGVDETSRAAARISTETVGEPIGDAVTTVADLKRWVLDFSRAREWEKFHNPKDLGVALMIEVGEVLEHFRFRTDAEIADHAADPAAHREIAHELADVLWALLRLADVLNVDLAASLHEKLALAAVKYPADLVRGKSHKYTHYQKPTGTTPTDSGMETEV